MLKFLCFVQRLLQLERTWWWLTSLLKKNKKYHRPFFCYFLKCQCDRNGFPKFALAYCYDKGIFVAENPRKAFLLASESAQAGNAFGLNLLGIFYENGYGTVRDISKACELYLKSAQIGCSHGKTSLAKYYIDVANPKAKEVIDSYLIQATKKKNPYALNLLGMLYVRGEYVPLNYNKGLKLCYAAAKKRNYYGILSVIYICENRLVKMSNKKRQHLLSEMYKKMKGSC